MSQFDSLLDFGDEKQQSNDFDPFGASPTIEMKGGGGAGSDLLGDFSFGGQASIQTNGTHNDTDLLGLGSSNNVNPLYELQNSSEKSSPVNPLYNMEAEFSTEPQKQEVTSSASANPLYDFMSNDGTNGHEDASMDLMGTSTTMSSEDSGVTMDAGVSVETGVNMDIAVNSESSQIELLQEEEVKANDEPIIEITDNNVIEEQEEIVDLGNDHQQESTDEQQESVDVNDEQQESTDVTEDQEESTGVTEDQEESTDVAEEQQESIYVAEEQQESIDVAEEQQESTDVAEEEQESTDVAEEEQESTDQVTNDDQEDSAAEQMAKTEAASPTKEAPGTQQQQQNASVVQNGLEKDVHFDEMSSIKNKFESNKSTVVTSKVNVQEEIVTTQAGEYENQPEKFEQWQNKAEGGVFENQPQDNEEVVKEDRKIHAEELPEQGLVRNIFNKFKQIQDDGPQQNFKKELSPPDRTAKYEYVSEPRSTFEMPKEKVEAGVFESQPEDPEDVVRAGDVIEEVLPEKGSAQNVLAKFKQFESQVGDRPPPSPGMRELTPDRNTKGEYVSEPRAVMPQYEVKVESGTFESQPQDNEDVVKSGQHAEEVVPERGTALSLVSRFTEIETQSKSQPAPHMKKELTPDRNTKGEYVSEPRGFVETYEGKSESGVFESQPQDESDIVKSGDYIPEPLPEAGYAKNVAAKFREIEKSGGSSPSGTPQRFKEVTPPREDTGKGLVAGVLESTPQELPGVVKSSDERVFEEELPERGTAKNLLNRFKEIQSSQSPTSRQKKEFTPPPESNFGVYENTPQPSLQVDIRPSESGILESTPKLREDVAREAQATEGETAFPESGFAKNMVSKWKQIESDSGKATPSPKYKEFTPPRDGRNLMSPKSPAGVNSSVQPNDLPGQYHEQSSAGVFENNPEHNEGITREADTDFAEGLPARDTTKSLLQRFKSIQDTAKESEKRPEPVNRKETAKPTPAAEPKKEFDRQSDAMEDPVSGGEPQMFDSAADDSLPVTSAQNTGSKRCSFMPTLEKCEACQKTVYAMEKLEYNKNIFHRSCFRCSKCKTTLTPKTFSCNSGILFCTTHYKQLFNRKGNYDEGFGRQQHKKRWGGQGGETQVEQSANGH